MIARVACCRGWSTTHCDRSHGCGDVLFAEADGVVVIPEKIAPEVLERAVEVAERENRVRADLLAGSTMRAAWDKHRAL